MNAGSSSPRYVVAETVNVHRPILPRFKPGRSNGVQDNEFAREPHDRIAGIASDLPKRLWLKNIFQHVQMGKEPDPRMEVLMRINELIQGLVPEDRVLLEETKEQRIWMFFSKTKDRALLVRFTTRTRTFERSVIYPSNDHCKRMWREFKATGRRIVWVESVSAT